MTAHLLFYVNENTLYQLRYEYDGEDDHGIIGCCGPLQVSNHVASVDDPFVIASLLPPSIFLNAHSLRWTLCATDRCFSNPATSAFFRCVKVLPVSRGDGIYQKVIFFTDP